MGTHLTIDLPDDLQGALKAVGYTPQRLSDEARQHLAVALFSRRVLSLEHAAKLAGMSLWNFIPFLGEQGIPVADYDEEETRIELESARWLSGRQKKL